MNDLTVNVHDYLTDEQIAEVCKKEDALSTSLRELEEELERDG